MADNHIQFRIGSTFQGEGFKKAALAIQENQREIRSATRGLGELTSTVEGISPAAAKAVSAVKGIGSAFVAGGIVGGAIQLALQGVGLVLEKVVEKTKEAAEASKTYAGILKDQLLAALGNSEASFSRLHRQIGDLNKELEQTLKGLNGDVEHAANQKINQIKIDFADKLGQAMTDAEKAVIVALRDREIALVKANAAEEMAANQIDVYRGKVDNAGKIKEAAAERLAAAEKSVAELQERSRDYISKRQQIENYLTTQEERYAEGAIGLREILVARKDANLALKKLEEENAPTVQALSDADGKLASAREDLAAAERDYKGAQLNLHASVQRRDEALQEITITEKETSAKVRDAQERNAMRIEEENYRREKLIAEADELIEDESYLGSATKRLAAARGKAADAIEGGGSEDETGEKDDKSGEKRFKGLEPILKRSIKGAVSSAWAKVDWKSGEDVINKPKKLDDATWDRIKTGAANVADYDRMHRFQEMDNRYAESGLNRVGADFATLISILDKPRSHRSEADKDFVNTFTQYVYPQLDDATAQSLLSSFSSHLLTSSKMDELLGENSPLLRKLNNLGLK